MTRPKTYGAYADCYPLFDAALRAGGARLPLPTLRKAISFRHRLYRARKLMQNSAEAQAKPGELVQTPYDTIYLQLEQDGALLGVGESGALDQPADLIFRVRGAGDTLEGAMRDLEGNPLEPDADFDKELLEGLEGLRGKLRLE